MTGALEGLAELARQETERTGLLARLEEAHRQQVVAAERHDAAAEKLDGELEDVARLESMSMTRILAGLRGTRDSDLSREQAEAEAARYAAADAEARRTIADREVEDLERRIEALDDLPARRAALLAQREAEVAADPGAIAVSHQLTALAQRLGVCEGELAELEEALEAAHVARRALGSAQDHLVGATRWSTYDTLFDGGFVSDIKKYNQLDVAGDKMREADAALAHLTTELADVDIATVGEVGITEMARAFDVWFDNIFSDWAVRERIKEASVRVDGLVVAVDDLCRELVTRRDAAVAERTSLLEQRERLLVPDGAAGQSTSPST